MLERMKAGDDEAKRILIEKNMRLVAHMSKKYASSERDIDDLISVGTIGLIKALNSFDADKGIKFATYAARCIDNELLMMLRSEKKRAKDVSLFETIGSDKEGNEIGIIEIIGQNEEDVVARCIYDQQIECIANNFKKLLSEREQEILIARYGLFGHYERTQHELAEKMGISRSYVSRLEKKALDKLRKLLNDNEL